MGSPFPGMDPYLEAPDIWPGVHALLISYAVEQLQPQLRPRGYFVDANERIWLEESSRSVYPDVAVVKRPVQAADVASHASGVLIADEPVHVHAMETEIHEGFLEIFDQQSHQLISSIEFLSPANKTGKGREVFQRKQRELQNGGVNLVEIDLLRGGEHVLAVPQPLVESLRPWNYLVVLSRIQGHDFEVYPIGLRGRLPRIRIPLKSTDADGVLDLQALLDRAYNTGPYPDRLNYRSEPTPVLTEIEMQWAGELLRRHELRD